jgi:uncharacterized protein involved in response to NO
MTRAAGGIPRYRAWNGPRLLGAGFRPFFLLAGLTAALVVPVWLAMFAGYLTVPTAFDPLSWHVHEMLFGFVQAAVTGFLLTAVPNWTGRMPIQARASARSPSFSSPGGSPWRSRTRSARAPPRRSTSLSR